MSSIDFNTYYHTYNRGINVETIFREPDNYRHFLHPDLTGFQNLSGLRSVKP